MRLTTCRGREQLDRGTAAGLQSEDQPAGAAPELQRHRLLCARDVPAHGPPPHPLRRADLHRQPAPARRGASGGAQAVGARSPSDAHHSAPSEGRLRLRHRARHARRRRQQHTRRGAVPALVAARRAARRARPVQPQPAHRAEPRLSAHATGGALPAPQPPHGPLHRGVQAGSPPCALVGVQPHHLHPARDRLLLRPRVPAARPQPAPRAYASDRQVTEPHHARPVVQPPEGAAAQHRPAAAPEAAHPRRPRSRKRPKGDPIARRQQRSARLSAGHRARLGAAVARQADGGGPGERRQDQSTPRPHTQGPWSRVPISDAICDLWIL